MHPIRLVALRLATLVALLAVEALRSQGQDAPVLSLRPGAPYRGRIAGLELTATGDLLVVGWLSDRRPDGNAAQLLPQVVVLTTEGRVTNRTLVSSLGTNAYAASGTSGRLEARFADGSFLCSVYSPEISDYRKIRLFPDGRPDAAAPKFPSGPASVQTDGSVVVGASFEDKSAFASPLIRYTLRDDPLRGSVVVEDATFLAHLAAESAVRNLACEGLAAANDGAIWTLLVDYATPSARRRLFRVLPEGHLDARFQPLHPIFAGIPPLLPSTDGSVLIHLQDSWDNSAEHLRRIRRDGSEDPAFRPQLDGWGITPLLPEPGGSTVCQWAGLWPDDPPRVIRLTPSGDVDPGFTNEPVFRGDSTIPRPTRRVLRRSDGRLWVAYGDWEAGGIDFPIQLLGPDGSPIAAFSDAGLGEVPTLYLEYTGGTPRVSYKFEVNTTGAPDAWKPVDGAPFLYSGLPGAMALYRLVAR